MFPPRPFTVSNWYWYVGGDTTQAYSSAKGVFVPSSDPTFESWLSGGPPTNIDTAANLGGMLAQDGGPRPIDTGVLAGYQAWFANAVMTAPMWPVVSQLQNQVRVLQGQLPLSAQQQQAAVAALM